MNPSYATKSSPILNQFVHGRIRLHPSMLSIFVKLPRGLAAHRQVPDLQMPGKSGTEYAFVHLDCLLNASASCSHGIKTLRAWNENIGSRASDLEACRGTL